VSRFRGFNHPILHVYRFPKSSPDQKNPEVHLTCGVTDLATAQTSTAQTYLQIQGKAELSTDKTEREVFWNDYLKRYFKGPDDPNYGIIIVKPYRIKLYTMGNFKPEVWKN
jgi:general stress protein 26